MLLKKLIAEMYVHWALQNLGMKVFLRLYNIGYVVTLKVGFGQNVLSVFQRQCRQGQFALSKLRKIP